MKRTSDLDPSKVIVTSFVLAALVGAALLKLPGATAEGRPLSWLDAFFMAASAVCVTGLSVINIGTDLTRFGQNVILVLMQIGGLGIMTFSVFFQLLATGRASFMSRLSVGLEPDSMKMRSLLDVLVFVLLMTLSFELLGAGLLFMEFRNLHSFSEAVYSAVFHAVSAFCNAGFGLYADSAMSFRTQTLVPMTLMFLIAAGGIGYMIINEIRLWLWATVIKRERFRLSLHSRICFVGTAGLILFGTLLFWLLERGNQLDGMTPVQQVINSMFLAVTSRTAGFNMVDTGLLTGASLFLLIIYMFIGACPGSAAGGIKIPTLAVLLALSKDQIKGRNMASVFARKFPAPIVARALGIFAAAFISLTVCTLLLQVTENAGVAYKTAPRGFLDLLFEATSAFGTVGLSTGITPLLSQASKGLIILLMFAGRVGPLTLGIAIMQRKFSGPKFEYVEEEIIIG